MVAERNLIAPEAIHEDEELCPNCEGPLRPQLTMESTLCGDCEIAEEQKPLSEKFPKQITQRCVIPGNAIPIPGERYEIRADSYVYGSSVDYRDANQLYLRAIGEGHKHVTLRENFVDGYKILSELGVAP